MFKDNYELYPSQIIRKRFKYMQNDTNLPFILMHSVMTTAYYLSIKLE